MLVLLDTNAYLRLAKRVRPAVGVVFGHKGYVLTIHKSVEDEVHRSAWPDRLLALGASSS
jgi:hypothetical protein